MGMRDELAAMAAQIAARNRLFLAAMPRPRVVAAPLTVRVADDRGPDFGKPTCSLCGDPSDLQVCPGCSVGFAELGL